MISSFTPAMLSTSELTRLREIARRQGLSEAEIIRRAVSHYLLDHDHPNTACLQNAQLTSENKLKAIIEHAPEPIFIKDRRGRYMLVNPAMAAAVGRSTDEIIGQTDEALMPRETAHQIVEDDRKVLASRELRTVEEVLKNGNSERVYQTIKFPYYSQSQDLLGLIGIARDVTEQKHLESALTELAQGLSASTGQTFFTSIARYLSKALQVDYVLIDELSTTDPHMLRPVVLMQRGELVEGFAYPIEGTPCQMVLGKEFRAFPKELAAQFPHDPFIKPLELESYAGIPLFDASGAPMGLVAVMHTTPLKNLDYAHMLLKVVAKRLEAELERKRAEEAVIQRTVELEKAKELDRLKTSFVNSVSHELRTPLTSIIGYAEFLEDRVGGTLTPDQDEFVHQIQESTLRLQRLVDDLLDFARMDAGTFRLKRDLIDLAPKIREIVASFLPQSQESHLDLKLELDQELPLLMVDAQRIGQVLANMLSNALKFTSPGGTIVVRVIPESDDVRFEVEDNGEGIASEDIPKLFQRFGQLAGGIRKGGTGLGLSISKALVEAHGGSIGVRSVQPHGAVFWFTLPHYSSTAES